jgi:hypothetical protein
MPKVFFFLISQKNLLKAQKGATLSTQGVYRGGLGEREKKERNSEKLITLGANQPAVQEKRVKRRK